jgi:hypothetical protein
LLSQQEADRRDKDSISDKLKKLAERIKKNNQTISNQMIVTEPEVS